MEMYNNDIKQMTIRNDDSLTAFLRQGGVSDSNEFWNFIFSMLKDKKKEQYSELSIDPNKSGCSAFSARSAYGGYLFGRNFDFRRSQMLIVRSEPLTGYASLSTVNPDIIKMPSGGSMLDPENEELLRLIALFLPLDGMNERGLCVSVNKINDDARVFQTDSGKTGQMTGSLIRTLLDRAADVDEAVEILNATNFHTSGGYFVHFAIADAKGHSVCAEYVDNRLSIIETDVVTNFYLTPGEKYGIGTRQSHLRYDTLKKLINEKKENNEGFSAEDAKRALASVAKSNYPAEGELYTEWSVVYDQLNLRADYYRREEYDKEYKLSLNGKNGNV